MTLKVGDFINIDDIPMCCTCVKTTADYTAYHFVWFVNGDLHETDFGEKELDILMAKKEETNG